LHSIASLQQYASAKLVLSEAEGSIIARIASEIFLSGLPIITRPEKHESIH